MCTSCHIGVSCKLFSPESNSVHLSGSLHALSFLGSPTTIPFSFVGLLVAVPTSCFEIWVHPACWSLLTWLVEVFLFLKWELAKSFSRYWCDILNLEFDFFFINFKILKVCLKSKPNVVYLAREEQEGFNEKSELLCGSWLIG